MRAEPTHDDRIEIALTAIANISRHALRRTYGVVSTDTHHVPKSVCFVVEQATCIAVAAMEPYVQGLRIGNPD